MLKKMLKRFQKRVSKKGLFAVFKRLTSKINTNSTFSTVPNRFKEWVSWIEEAISLHSRLGIPSPNARPVREDGWLVKHSKSGDKIRCSAKLEYCTLTLRPKKVKALSEETINLEEFSSIERVNDKDNTFRIIHSNGNGKTLTFSTAPISFDKWTKAIGSSILNQGQYIMVYAV